MKQEQVIRVLRYMYLVLCRTKKIKIRSRYIYTNTDIFASRIIRTRGSKYNEFIKLWISRIFKVEPTGGDIGKLAAMFITWPKLFLSRIPGTQELPDS